MQRMKPEDHQDQTPRPEVPLGVAIDDRPDKARKPGAAAQESAAGLRAAGFQPTVAVEANEIFIRLPRDLVTRLRAAGLRAADWPTAGDDGAQGTIRLVTSWATTEDEVAALLRAL